MVKAGVFLLLLVVALSGCATTTTFTLANGETITATKVVEETASTYVVEEEGTGRKTVIPKGAVVSVKGRGK